MQNITACGGYGSLGDRVFIGNTIPDTGSEPGLGGVTVDLHGGTCPANGVLDSVDRIATRVTNTDGTCSFGTLIPGEYCITVNDGTAPVQYTLATGNPLDAASQSTS